MWTILLFGFFFAGAVVHGFKGQETYLSPTGLAFVKEDEIIVTGDSWTIVMVINAKQHLTNAQMLQEHLTDMELEMKEKGLLNGGFLSELERLNFIVESLLKANEALFDMLAKGRSKRDLLGFLRPLFGAASSRDVYETSRRVSKLQETVVKQQAFQEHQLSINKVLNDKIEENTKKLDNLTETIKNEIKRVEGVISQLRNKIDRVDAELQQYTNMSSRFRLLQSIGLHSLVLSNSLQLGLEMAAEGRLSFSLISAKELQNELIKITSFLPFGLKLISGLRLDDMYKYREVAEVVAVAQDELIMISIKIPLLSHDRGFDLYKVRGLPVKDINSGRFLRIEPDGNYFIVSNDEQHYGIMNYEDVEKCRGKSPKVCPATLTLTTKYLPSCLSAVYFKEDENIAKYCSQSILVKEHRPIWVQDNKNMGWIYSVARPTKVTLFCGEKITDHTELVGTNILANVSHCSILGQEFKLFRSSEGFSYSNGTFSISAVKPLTPSILNQTIAGILTNNVALEKAVEDLRKEGLVKEGQGHSEEVKVEMLLSKMELSEEGPQSPSAWKTVVLPAFVSLIVSAAICYLILYYDKNHVARIKFPFLRKDRIPQEEGVEETFQK